MRPSTTPPLPAIVRTVALNVARVPPPPTSSTTALTTPIEGVAISSGAPSSPMLEEEAERPTYALRFSSDVRDRLLTVVVATCSFASLFVVLATFGGDADNHDARASVTSDYARPHVDSVHAAGTPPAPETMLPQAQLEPVMHTLPRAPSTPSASAPARKRPRAKGR